MAIKNWRKFPDKDKWKNNLTGQIVDIAKTYEGFFKVYLLSKDKTRLMPLTTYGHTTKTKAVQEAESILSRHPIGIRFDEFRGNFLN